MKRVFRSEEEVINYIKTEINVEDYSEEKGCDCIICNAKRFSKMKKSLGITR